MNLLLVEDNPGDAQLVAEAFRAHCDKIDIATTLHDAKEMMSSKQGYYDFALVDPGLPNSFGVDALLGLTEFGVPVVVLTGQGKVSDAMYAIKRGLAGYWTKDQVMHANFAWAVVVAVAQFKQVKATQAHVEHLESIVKEYAGVKKSLLGMEAGAKHSS